jgi:hypothetical protein
MFCLIGPPKEISISVANDWRLPFRRSSTFSATTSFAPMNRMSECSHSNTVATVEFGCSGKATIDPTDEVSTLEVREQLLWKQHSVGG